MGGAELVADSFHEAYYATLAEEFERVVLENKGEWFVGKLGTSFAAWPDLTTVDYLKDITYVYRFSKKGVKRWASILYVASKPVQRKLTPVEEWTIVRNSFAGGRESIDWSLVDRTNNIHAHNFAPIIPWSLWLKHLASKRMKQK